LLRSVTQLADALYYRDRYIKSTRSQNTGYSPLLSVVRRQDQRMSHLYGMAAFVVILHIQTITTCTSCCS